jgi:membrane protease YdiL (CAAX protease family)
MSSVFDVPRYDPHDVHGKPLGSDLPPSLWVCFAALLVGMVASGLVAVLASAAHAPHLALVTATEAVLWLPWLAVSVRRPLRQWARAVGVRRCSARLLVASAATGIFVQILAGYVLYVPLHYLDPNLFHELSRPSRELFGSRSDVVADVVLSFLAVVLAPAVEEVFFRGTIFRRLVTSPRVSASARPLLAVAGSSLVFALAHLELLQFPALLLVGSVLAVLYYRTNNLVASFVAHASFNLVAVISYFF